MEILIGIVLYALFLFFFISLGKFTKDCDNSMREQFKN
jgi:hypothetical protein